MHALTQPEIRKLLQVAKAARERDWLMILVAYLHGLRAAEVCGGWSVNGKKQRTFNKGITAANIRDGFLGVQRLKGSKKTIQELVSSHDPLYNERDPLIEFARQSKPGKPIFGVNSLAFLRIVRRHAIAAGIPAHKAHPHALKHSIAIHLLDAGVPLPAVQQWLGHKSLGSTGVYLAVTDEQAGKVVTAALGLAQGRLIL